VDVASALSDKIVIHSIHVEAPEITFEGGLRDNNLFKIRDNLTAGAATNPNAPTAAGAKSAKKIEVDDFLITNAVVHLNFTGLGGLKKTCACPPFIDRPWQGGCRDDAGGINRQNYRGHYHSTIQEVTMPSPFGQRRGRPWQRGWQSGRKCHQKRNLGSGRTVSEITRTPIQ